MTEETKGPVDLVSLKLDKIKKYEMLREGRHHEWTILSTRIVAYISSQALFASGAAILYGNSDKNSDLYPAVLILSAIAICLALLSSISISINICVLNDWHRLITAFLEEDSKSEGILRGYYLPRKQPDMLHKISVVYYCRAITIIAGCAWMAAIASALHRYVDFINVIGATLVIINIIVLWVIFLISIESKWGPLNSESNK